VVSHIPYKKVQGAWGEEELMRAVIPAEAEEKQKRTKEDEQRYIPIGLRKGEVRMHN
jgi:hypothetical protein